MNPTVGRIVHWYDPTRRLGPFAAIVTFTQNHVDPEIVELTLFPSQRHEGIAYARVVLQFDPGFQADPTPPTDRPYWCWLPREGM